MKFVGNNEQNNSSFCRKEYSPTIEFQTKE
jgi:hypothetical protein